MTGGKIRGRSPEKKIRAELGFPKTTQLVFYPDPQDINSKTDIIEWDIVERRADYAVISIRTKNRVYKKMHSGIVAFMQKPNFIGLNNR